MFPCITPFLVCVHSLAESLIGVSQVPIPAKGEGNKGASIPPRKIDTSGWKATSVVGPNGAKGNAGPNGFYGGGESQAEKDAIMKKKKTVGTVKTAFGISAPKSPAAAAPPPVAEDAPPTP